MGLFVSLQKQTNHFTSTAARWIIRRKLMLKRDHLHKQSPKMILLFWWAGTVLMIPWTQPMHLLHANCSWPFWSLSLPSLSRRHPPLTPVVCSSTVNISMYPMLSVLLLLVSSFSIIRYRVLKWNLISFFRSLPCRFWCRVFTLRSILRNRWS